LAEIIPSDICQVIRAEEMVAESV